MAIQEKRCKICSTPFTSNNPRQYLCANPECRRINAVNRTKEWNALHFPESKTVGTTLVCPRCNKEFIKAKARQSYCLDCSDRHVWQAKQKASLIGVPLTKEILEQFERELVAMRKEFIHQQALKYTGNAELHRYCARENHYQSEEATRNLIAYLKKQGVPIQKPFIEKVFPVEYFDVRGKATAIGNAYFYLEHLNGGPITPQTRASSLGSCPSLFRLFGLQQPKQKLQLKRLMFILVPMYVKSLLGQEQNEKLKIAVAELPHYLQELIADNLNAIRPWVEKYQSFGCLTQKIDNKTLLDIVMESQERQKQFLHYVIFDKTDPWQFFTNAYLYLRALVDKLEISPEGWTAKEFDLVPQELCSVFGYKRKNMNKLKFIWFDLIPKVCQYTAEYNQYPDDMSVYLMDKGLTVPDFTELHKLTKSFLHYGAITERHIQILRDNNLAGQPLCPILFYSSMFDSKLKERDLDNIRKFFAACTEAELQRFTKNKRFLQPFALNLLGQKSLKKFVDKELQQRTTDLLQRKPTFFLDKNVLFRFANAKVLKRSPDPHCDELIEIILQKKAIGVISNDCIKAVYGHLRYNLAKPKSEGGLELEADECEKQALAFVKQYVLHKDSVWKIVCYQENILHDALTDRKHTAIKDYEDRLEFYAFLQSSTDSEGPTVFVSNDSHFFEPEVQKSVDKRTHDKRFQIIQTPKIALSALQLARDTQDS